MTIQLAPNQGDVQQVLGNFLLNILPTGVVVIEGQDNRVPEPSATEFVIMTTTRRSRLATNLDAYADCMFTASIAGNIMTVPNAPNYGTITLGNILFGVNVASGTTVVSQSSGSVGGSGVYQLSGTATLSGVYATGVMNVLQSTEVTVQLDVHSNSVTKASDMAQRISTLFRDDYAVRFFKASGYDVAPLYADEPRQLPFWNDQSQVETRWVIEAVLQANQVVLNIPQQFADTVTVTNVPADIFYAP